MYISAEYDVYEKKTRFITRYIRASLDAMASQEEKERSRSRGSSPGDILASRTARVAPLEVPAETKPPRLTIKKQLDSLNARFKRFTTENDIKHLEAGMTSFKSKMFIFIIACGCLALGIGLTYQGTVTQLRDCYVIGIGSIVICFLFLTGLLVVYLRERHHLRKAKDKQLLNPQSLEQLEQGEQLNDIEYRYFVALGDTSRGGVRNQRRPSDAQLYGQTPVERTIAQISQARRHMSAGLRSDGVLTVSGVEVEDSSDSARRLHSTPPLHLPSDGVLDPDRGLGGNENDESGTVSSSGVYTTRLPKTAAAYVKKMGSLDQLKLKTAEINREITDLYREPTEREKNLASVERSISELE